MQKNRNWGTRGKVGYPPPGSQLFPVHGSAKSEPVDWSELTPRPGTPLPLTRAATDVSVKRPSKFGPPRGGGVSPVPPSPHCDGSDGASAVNPLQPQLRTPVISPPSDVSPERLAMSPSYASHTPPTKSCQARGMAGKPCSLLSAYSS